MNIITRTAISNLKSNRSRNILIGIAIALTTVLLTTVPTVIFGMIDLQFFAANEAYPTYHAMFRQVREENAKKMQEDPDLTEVGVREDPAYMVCPDEDVSIVMVYVDDQTASSNRLELKEGRLPEAADEIVVSPGLLEAMGLRGDLGGQVEIPFQAVERGGLGSEQRKTFTIVGMIEDGSSGKEQKTFSALVSKAFADEVIPDGEHVYRVCFRIAGAERMTVDAIEQAVKDKSKVYDVAEGDIVENSEYLFANYVDPALYSGLAVFVVIIVLAGALTIYSIYYVSMLHKVQEYGKLRAIGATRRQIRKLVFREGFVAAAIAIPIGLAIGSAAGVGVLHGMLRTGTFTENPLMGYMREALEQGEVSLVNLWILGTAAATALITVYLSLLRPMQVAGKISPVEAIRYEGALGKQKKAKLRKGYQEMSTTRLMLSNLGRNRKRTAITIFTLGVTGIFFMVVATVLSCMSPQVMAEDAVRGDISIYVDSWEGDAMNPERELKNIQRNNPLTEELKEQILAVPGVESIEEELYAGAVMPEVTDPYTGEAFSTGVTGIGEEEMDDLDRYVEEGSLDDPKLADGTGIILGRGYVAMELGVQVGDKVNLELEDGERIVAKEFEVVAYADPPASLGSGFMLPSEVLESFCETKLADTWNLTVYEDREGSVEKTIREIVDGQEFLEMDTYREQYEMAEMTVGYLHYGGYGLLAVLGFIGILNLINTMINSVYVRQKELGMLQAIGLSGRQTGNMLQKEGLFYTAGTLVLSLGSGSIAGYLCYRFAAAEGILSIKTYHYPVIPAIVLTLIVLAVQLLIAFLVNQNFKRTSLIDRIRFAQ
ncbi:MAG TPA: ABC transporter permease [Candidatus Dorea gallistercoris]|uniref:ABC transporter permease n=1 Tax=Candidatus Dorea gallistercoris TaxID=2838542 RepID=A0A9D1RAS4_9FIRM|nr:ABC transporter permease [Candidatus Dorea gallistercoris]